MRSAVMLACAFVVALAVPVGVATGASSPSVFDRYFVARAAAGDRFEVQLGRLGAASANQSLQALGRRLMLNHCQSSASMAALAKALRIALPTSLPALPRWQLTLASSLTGAPSAAAVAKALAAFTRSQGGGQSSGGSHSGGEQNGSGQSGGGQSAPALHSPIAGCSAALAAAAGSASARNGGSGPGNGSGSGQGNGSGSGGGSGSTGQGNGSGAMGGALAVCPSATRGPGASSGSGSGGSGSDGESGSSGSGGNASSVTGPSGSGGSRSGSPTFGREYAQLVLATHQQSILDFCAAATTGSRLIRAYAISQLPLLRMHATMAAAALRSVGSSSSGGSGTKG
jgi:hypothetical protein